MSWAGMYALDLYCDKVGPNLPGKATDGVHKWDEFPHQYTNELGSVCRSAARRDGWIITNDGGSICPKCSGKRAAPSNPPVGAQQEKDQ